MQHDRMMPVAAAQQTPLLKRLFAKVVVDVMPAALASVIGGLFIAHYQFGNAAAPPPAAAQATAPAPQSTEMLALVRDEHAMIVGYINAQVAAEKSRHAAEDEAVARAVADAKAASEAAAAQAAAPAAPLPHSFAETVAAAKPVAPPAPRPKVAAAAPVPLPAPRAQQLALAQAEADPNAAPDPGSAAAPPPAPESKSLLARTLDKTINIKDHVVHATVGVVSAIGNIPSWIASLGDRFGGNSGSSGASSGRLLLSSS